MRVSQAASAFGDEIKAALKSAGTLWTVPLEMVLGIGVIFQVTLLCPMSEDDYIQDHKHPKGDEEKFPASRIQGRIIGNLFGF